MVNFFSNSLFIFLFLFSSVFSTSDPHITVYLIGDSTMAEKDVHRFPETGWGMPFHDYFDSTVVVNNRAKDGASTRTFIEEGRWNTIVDHLEDGDYVLIQFGHNDEVPYKESYTPPEQFKANLVKFVKETRSKKAIPILITPVTRRGFDASGNVVETHPCYANFVKDVASKHNVSLIDLNDMSKALLQKLGAEKSKDLWIHLSKGENSNYPDGRVDNTHFNEFGARKMAELVLLEIKKLDSDLAERVQ